MDAARTDGGLRFADPEGLEHELVVSSAADAPLIAEAPDVPREHALQGFEAVRAYTSEPARSEALLRDVLGFAGGEDGLGVARRRARRLLRLRRAAARARVAGRGDGASHRVGVADGGPGGVAGARAACRARPTPVIDRFWFRSVYFREPSGVLFEIATMGPGFATDEDPAHLGERLVLPPRFEPLREQVERTLTPLPDPRARAAASP